MKKIWLIVVILCVVAISVFAVLPRMQGEVAPGFTLTDVDGVKFSLGDFRGRVVIIDFMSTSCPPCVVEILHLKEIQSVYGEQVVILSIGNYPSV